MIVLVTGVAGFIGSAIASRLRDEGHKVIGVDDLSTGSPENVPRGIPLRVLDIARPKSLDDFPENFEAVLHLAGQSSGELSFLDPVGDLTRNTMTTLNVIDFARRRQINKVLYASSMSVYGDVQGAAAENFPLGPKSCYGASKLASENYLRIFAEHVPTISLRMFNVYGPGQDLSNLRQGMVSIYLAMAIFDRSIRVRGSLDRFRDFIYIDDVVEVWLKLLRVDFISGSAVNVGSGVKTTVRQLLDSITEMHEGTSVSIDEPTPGDQLGIFADTQELSHYVDVSGFTSLREGLDRFNRWARGTLRNEF